MGLFLAACMFWDIKAGADSKGLAALWFELCQGCFRLVKDTRYFSFCQFVALWPKFANAVRS